MTGAGSVHRVQSRSQGSNLRKQENVIASINGLLSPVVTAQQNCGSFQVRPWSFDMDSLENRTGFTDADRQVLRAVLGDLSSGHNVEAAAKDPVSALACVDQALSLFEPALPAAIARTPHAMPDAALLRLDDGQQLVRKFRSQQAPGRVGRSATAGRPLARRPVRVILDERLARPVAGAALVALIGLGVLAMGMSGGLARTTAPLWAMLAH